MIVLFIEDVIEQKVYELQISSQLSFYDIMCHLREKENCSKLLVYEKYTRDRCDTDVSLNTLGVQDGMYFYVL